MSERYSNGGGVVDGGARQGLHRNAKHKHAAGKSANSNGGARAASVDAEISLVAEKAYFPERWQNLECAFATSTLDVTARLDWRNQCFWRESRTSEQ